MDELKKQTAELTGFIDSMEASELTADIDFSTALSSLREMRLRLADEANELCNDLCSEMLGQAEKVADVIRKKHSTTERRSKDINDTMNCPCCDGTVFYRLSATNGHIGARCTSNHCISFQE